ncbi:MAG: CoA-binding protein [Candidatus Hydrothermales bacterium]
MYYNIKPMSDEKIKKILLEYKNIATVGFSTNPEKPARKVPVFLISKGYNVIPVNPNHEKILGRKSYKSILDVEEKIEIVQVFRPSEEVPKIVEDIIKRRNLKGDVKVLWLQEGIKSKSTHKLKELGIDVIEDRCMYKEYVRLFKDKEG